MITIIKLIPIVRDLIVPAIRGKIKFLRATTVMIATLSHSDWAATAIVNTFHLPIVHPCIIYLLMAISMCFSFYITQNKS